MGNNYLHNLGNELKKKFIMDVGLATVRSCYPNRCSAVQSKFHNLTFQEKDKMQGGG